MINFFIRFRVILIITGLVLIPIIFLFKCKSENKKSDFISVPSLIEQQVKHVDSSLYSITKYIYNDTDTIPSDTIYIKREEFRKEAEAFLNSLDLSLQKNAKNFTQETRYDELLKKVIISYTPIDATKQELQSEEIMVDHSLATGDKVTTILINNATNNKDGFSQYEMLWQLDKSFQITETKQKPGENPKTRTYKVIWDGDIE